ncbi:MAG: hypothetical protein KIT46_07545 [Anaerolineales bacterium]|nr:hypothetical protein [Anaerolineales bacterium]MCW5855883.1 hypothetical protein [Anaerolineales bacterium]
MRIDNGTITVLGREINISALSQPRTLAAVAFAAGLIVGLVVLGWWLFPVNWTDASVADLRADLRADYLRAAIDSYTLEPNDALARQRLGALGEFADETMAAVAAAPGGQNIESLARFQALLGVTTPSTGGSPSTSGAGSTTSAEPLFGSGTLLTTLCGITLFVGLTLAVVYISRNRRRQGPAGPLSPLSDKNTPAAPPHYEEAGEDSPPLSQWMTTYVLGDDLYDDSFSIDSTAGDFMGECGVSISEAIGVGSPKRVSAFEVWLFDKNDVHTVTKVLMSTHLFRDDASRQRLATKGDPLLATPGAETVLETATLQMVARVVDMQYGEGPLPEESFFERVTLELAVWSKV